MDWIQGKGYEDAEGNYYHIVPFNDRYRVAKYLPDREGPEFLREMPWRITASDAQRDLDEMAAEKGWIEK